MQDLLASYDGEVEQALQALAATRDGTERARHLALLRRMVSVHDAVLTSVLAPLLDQLPDGARVAERLRRGCAERTDLLARFQALADGVAAPDVYPVNAAEVDGIVAGVTASFRGHEVDETTEVARVLAASATSQDTDVLAARMALAAHLAPTRAHPARRRDPASHLLNRLHHYTDALHDWSDTHHGWLSRRQV